jgi:hypothetical protein
MNDDYKEQLLYLAVAALGLFIIGPALAYGIALLIYFFVP